MMPYRSLLKIFIFLSLCPHMTPSIAGEAIVMGKSGYPVPRFVSLAKNTVNVRTGPDSKYPILWIFKKKTLPIKVVAEYNDWRKIIDSEGATGWVWGPLLSSRRTGLIVMEQQTLLRKPEQGQAASVKAEAGVIGKIVKCTAGWCLLNLNGFKGWLKQSQFWGTLEGEIVD